MQKTIAQVLRLSTTFNVIAVTYIPSNILVYDYVKRDLRRNKENRPTLGKRNKPTSTIVKDTEIKATNVPAESNAASTDTDWATIDLSQLPQFQKLTIAEDEADFEPTKDLKVNSNTAASTTMNKCQASDSALQVQHTKKGTLIDHWTHEQKIRFCLCWDKNKEKIKKLAAESGTGEWVVFSRILKRDYGVEKDNKKCQNK